MNFINKVRSSVYDPVFYKEIKNKTFGQVWGHFTLLVLVVSFVLTLFTSFQLLPNLKNVSEEIKTNIISKYPSELEVKIKNGEVSTNVPEPYFIKIPQDNLGDIKKDPEYEGIENLLVIDTKTNLSLSDFEKYKTLAWLTKNSIVIKQKGKVTIQDFGENKKFELTINKANLESWLGNFGPFLKFAKYILPIAIFLGYFISYHLLLIYFLIVAVLVFLLSKIIKLGLGYKDSYKITIFASTLSIILKAFSWGVLRYGHLPFVFTLIILIVVYINFKNQEKSTEVKSNEVI